MFFLEAMKEPLLLPLLLPMPAWLRGLMAGEMR